MKTDYKEDTKRLQTLFDQLNGGENLKCEFTLW